MFKQKIKKRIRNFITSLDLPHFKVIRWQLDDLAAQNILSSHFNFSSYFPLTNWSLRPSTILHVLNDISINSRKCIVDIGCGVSTIYMAKHLDLIKSRAKIYAIDESESWLRILDDYLKREGLSQYVELVHAPLIPSGLAISSNNLWYDTDILKSAINANKIDLILVDGPSGDSSPFARFGAVPHFKNFLSNRYSVFIDDTSRKDEKEIVKRWSDELNLHPLVYNRYVQFTTDNEFYSEPFFQMYDKLIKF
ncbi:class I SAM-dependent methyltransferase [Marinoscillum sp.]|uniref:class I SAM-dependent methyltransferase n=1 Tax=Marinoscillum sp. TaxID=2024838 RepID=UPI003BA9DFE0